MIESKQREHTAHLLTTPARGAKKQQAIRVLVISAARHVSRACACPFSTAGKSVLSSFLLFVFPLLIRWSTMTGGRHMYDPATFCLSGASQLKEKTQERDMRPYELVIDACVCVPQKP